MFCHSAARLPSATSALRSGSGVTGRVGDDDDDGMHCSCGGVRGRRAGRSVRAAMSSREMVRDGLWRTCRASARTASASRSLSRFRLWIEDVADSADAEELPESVRVRSRTVWIVFPDASEKGEEGGRGMGDDGVSCTVAGSESWRCMRRSVWRLFWNQTVTERMSLCVLVSGRELGER